MANVRTLRRRRLTRRPMDTRRTVTSQRLGRGKPPRRSQVSTNVRGRAPCRRRHYAKGEPCCGEGDPSSQTAGSESQERSGQIRRGKPRPGRDLSITGPVRSLDRGRRLPPKQSGWPMFFALVSCFSGETMFTKFVGEEIATACYRHTSKRRRIQMPASPRRRARFDHHEARVWIRQSNAFCGQLGCPGGST